jgi:alkylated DNA repair dioxygenase AlkB
VRGGGGPVIAISVLTPPLQRSLLGQEPTGFDAALTGLARIQLDETAWLDLVAGWVRGSDALFDEVLRTRAWDQRTRRMRQGRMLEPRLTSHWTLAAGEPLQPPLVEELRLCLSAHYGVVFDSVGFNLYRNGKDSVAWHGDHISKEIPEPVVPLVSLGEARKLLFRPRGGGPARAFVLGRGDLLVTGGLAQRTWEHAVPKVARAGPRISIAFRNGLQLRSYVQGEDEQGQGPGGAEERE